MKVLVIPDVHLKPDMFDKAEEIFKENDDIEGIVVLGDLVDDFGQYSNLGLYEETLNRAIKFATDFPSSLWCYGNHDVSYLWNKMESGFSDLAQPLVKLLSEKLQSKLKERITFVHKIDKILFSHAGVCQDFIDRYVPIYYDMFSVNKTIDWINRLNSRFLWEDNSPIWVRPQIYDVKMWKNRKFLQVVGHTPMKTTTKEKNLISCDTFSTYNDGTPYGDNKFTVVNTITKEFYTV